MTPPRESLLQRIVGSFWFGLGYLAGLLDCLSLWIRYWLRGRL